MHALVATHEWRRNSRASPQVRANRTHLANEGETHCVENETLR